MRVVDADYLEGERGLAQAVDRAATPTPCTRSSPALGYLPEPDSFEPERLLAQIQTAGDWYLEPGFRRLTSAYVTEVIERGSSPALALLRADAPRDDPAPGAADPPHGGARVRHPR